MIRDETSTRVEIEKHIDALRVDIQALQTSDAVDQRRVLELREVVEEIEASLRGMTDR